MSDKDILDIDDKDLSFLDVEKKGDDWLGTDKSEKTEEKTPVPKEQEQSVPINTDETQPKLMGTGYCKEYVDMVDRILAEYRKLPTLDYDAIYKEVSTLNVNSCPTPTLQVINQELQKVQAAKERVAEIMTNILRCYTLKKRVVDILKEAWGNYSSEKSADKRKGDAVFRLSDFDLDFSRTESALKVTSHICRNLDSLQENLSRRITIFQLQLKLHDVGRGALPDFEFKDDIDGDFGLGKSKSHDDEDAKTRLDTF